MIVLQQKHLDAIIKAGLIEHDIPDIEPNNLDKLHDIAVEALYDAGLVVHEFTAEQDKGA